MDELVKNTLPKIELQLKNQLLVSELIKKNAIEAAEEDVEKELEKYAKDGGEDIEQFRKVIKDKPEMLENIKFQIKQDKLFELLKTKNTIKKGKKVKYLDLFQ